MKRFLDLASVLTSSDHNPITFFIDFLKSKSSVYCLLNKTFFFPNFIFVCYYYLFWYDDLCWTQMWKLSIYEQMFWIRHWWESLKHSQKQCLLGKFAPPEHEHRRPEELAQVGLVFQGLHWHTHQHTLTNSRLWLFFPSQWNAVGKIINSHFKRSQL